MKSIKNLSIVVLMSLVVTLFIAQVMLSFYLFNQNNYIEKQSSLN